MKRNGWNGRIRRVAFWIVAGITALIPASAFSSTVKIGALLPMTGDLTKLGLTAQHTLEQSKEDFQIEYPGVTIDLLLADTKSDSATALAQVKELYNQGARVIIGPLVSADLAAIKPFVDEKGILVIDPTSSAPSLAFDDTIFRLTIPDTEQAKGLATYALYNKYQTVIPIYRQDAYGTELYEAFQEKFAEAGGTVVEGIGYSVPLSDASTLTASLSQKVQSILQTTTAENVAVLCIAYEEATKIFTEAAKDSVLSSVKWLGTDALAVSDSILADSVAAAFGVATQFTASINSSPAQKHPLFPSLFYYEDLITKIRVRYTDLNEAYVGVIYDALWLAALTMENSNGVGSKEGFLATTGHFYGYGGPLDFDENGDRLYGYFAFYRLAKDEASYQWDIVASYRKSKYQVVQPFYYREFVNDRQDKILKLGALLSLTGSYGENGARTQKSLAFIKERINVYLQRTYTTNSHVEIAIEDTASNPATALEKMKLLQQSGVNLFIGPLISSELEACMEYANAQGLFIISPSSTSMALAKDDNIFRFMLNDEKQAKSLANYLFELGYSYVQPIYRNDVYGQGLTDLFAAQFETLGGRCGNGIAYDPITTDFTSTVQSLNSQLSSSGVQKTAVLLIAFGEYVQIMDKASGYPSLGEVRWFGTDGTALSTLLSKDETASTFALKTRYTASIMSTSNFDICPYLENLKNDLTVYLGHFPTANDINACDAAWIFTKLPIYTDWNMQYTKDVVSYVINWSTGYMQSNMIDNNGDRLFGNFDFYEYSIPGETDTPNWKTNARYVYFYNLEGLTWLDEEPASQSANWEVYN